MEELKTEELLKQAQQRLDALEAVIAAILPLLAAQAPNRPEIEAAIDRLLAEWDTKPKGNEALFQLVHAIASPLGR